MFCPVLPQWICDEKRFLMRVVLMKVFLMKVFLMRVVFAETTFTSEFKCSVNSMIKQKRFRQTLTPFQLICWTFKFFFLSKLDILLHLDETHLDRFYIDVQRKKRQNSSELVSFSPLNHTVVHMQRFTKQFSTLIDWELTIAMTVFKNANILTYVLHRLEIEHFVRFAVWTVV